MALITLYLQQRLCATGLAAAALSFSCSGCVQLGVLQLSAAAVQRALLALCNAPCSSTTLSSVAVQCALLAHPLLSPCSSGCGPCSLSLSVSLALFLQLCTIFFSAVQRALLHSLCTCCLTGTRAESSVRVLAIPIARTDMMMMVMVMDDDHDDHNNG